MTNIIVAFSKPEDGKNIKGILVRNGYQVVAVCTSGSLALSAAEGVGSGIVVSGYRFEDMLYDELRQYLPAAFDMLLILRYISKTFHLFKIKISTEEACQGLIFVAHFLVFTVSQIIQ